MESIFININKNRRQKPDKFIINNSNIITPKSEDIQILDETDLQIPKIKIDTVNQDVEITEYNRVLLSNPKRSNIVIYLRKPKLGSYIIIKDVSASKKYNTIISCVDDETMIDMDKEYIINDPFESVSLFYSETDSKFYIY